MKLALAQFEKRAHPNSQGPVLALGHVISKRAHPLENTPCISRHPRAVLRGGKVATSIPRIFIEHLNGPDAGAKTLVTRFQQRWAQVSTDIPLRLEGITGEQGRLEQDGDRLIFIDSGSIHGTIHRRGSNLTPLGRLRQAEFGTKIS